VAIEKAFAIEATPEAIWDALWADLGEGDESLYTVEESTWPHSFTIRLDFAGMPSLLTYRIEPKDTYCEVSAALTPLARRYGIFWALTFGHIKHNYEVLLAQGLANLKAALEGDGEVGWDEDVETDAPSVHGEGRVLKPAGCQTTWGEVLAPSEGGHLKALTPPSQCRVEELCTARVFATRRRGRKASATSGVRQSVARIVKPKRPAMALPAQRVGCPTGREG
jgi:hypothetical protein